MKRTLVPNTHLVFDGLWQCLCPAVDRVALHRTLESRSAVQSSVQAPRVVVGRRRLGIRDLSTEATSVSRNGSYESGIAYHDSAASTNRVLESKPGTPRQLTVSDVLRDRLPSNSELKEFSIDVLEESIRTIRDSSWRKIPQTSFLDPFRAIIHLTNHLLIERDYKPNAFIYESLAELMSHPRGSADGLARLSKDMEAQGITPTAEYCHAALAALMNHPDYMQREIIMDTMKKYWYDRGTVPRQRYLLGLLRDEQYELAYGRIRDMEHDPEAIEPWVLDIFVFVYGKMGFLDEMVELFRQRQAYHKDKRSAASLLHYVLDVCSSANHIAGIRYAWHELVHHLDLSNPSTGILENVLNTASRSGDYELAETAFSYLKQQGRIQAYHYEALLESYVEGRRICKALSAIVEMRVSGIQITERTVLHLKGTLEKDEGLLERVLESPVLQQAEAGSFSYSVVSMLVELGAEVYGSARVLSLYRNIPRLCRCESSAQLVETMIIHSRGDEALTKDLVEKYAKLAPDEIPLTRKERSLAESERLILVFCEHRQMDPALQFAKAAAKKWTDPRRQRSGPAWLEVLVEAAVEMQDSRVWEVSSAFEAAGQSGAVDAMTALLQDAKASREADSATSVGSEQRKAETPLDGPSGHGVDGRTG